MKIERNDNSTRLSVFCPSGFHGDPYLLQLVDSLVEGVDQFIETGTEAGSTIGYVARMYPHMGCNSCETDEGTHLAAKASLVNHANVALWIEHSTGFLQDITTSPSALFWLDAHSHGWGCSLGEEITIILQRWQSGYILLDDFLVPSRPDFGFDWYDTFGKLDWATVSKDIPETLQTRINGIYYPNYPILQPGAPNRGWCLITFGKDTEDFMPPEFLTKDTSV